MPKWVDACVASYKEEHPNEPASKAWRICTAAYKKKYGHAPAREDVIRPHLAMLQEKVGTEEVKLSFSDDEKRQLLQNAVHILYGEPDDYGYVPWTQSWYITAVYDSHIVVCHLDLLYAIPYTVIDRLTVTLGEPEEVVAAYVTAEAEILDLLMHEGWLPKGTTQADLADGDFAWLSFEHQEGKRNRAHRRLPFKVRGEVSVEGWLAAWRAIQRTTYLRPNLSGGPDRKQVIAKLESAMPSEVKLDDDGHVSIEEEARDSILFEGQLEDFKVEEATAVEREKFALVFSGNVIPKPNTEHGVWSVNQRLYTTEAVDESYQRSLAYLEDGGVATVYTSHAAASHHMGRLPVGRVLGYSHDEAALRFRGGIVGTAEGNDAIKLLEAGVLGTVSLRAYEWESHHEEVDDLGECEVVDWCIIKGIDFATSPGLPGTQVKKEEEEREMKLSELTLEELQKERPDLVAELVAEAAPPPPDPEPDEAYELAILQAANSGLASVVATQIRERAKTIEEIPAVLAEARQAAIAVVYAQRQAGKPDNLRGAGTPAPPPPPPAEDELTDTEKAIIEGAGGEPAS
jgi:hypothetical protein